MIRMMTPQDMEPIISLLNEEVTGFDADELSVKLKRPDQQVLVFEDEGKCMGFAAASIMNPAKAFGDISLYVAETHRNKGIGTQLFKEAHQWLNEKDIQRIQCEIRTEKQDTGAFLKKQGFDLWFGFNKMIYFGDSVESSIPLMTYDPQYYDSYKDTYEEGFLPLRTALGFSPLRCCSSAEETLSQKDDIFIFVENQKVIGSFKLVENELDDLVVNPEYHGKGIGKLLLQAGVHQLQKRNCDPIWLGVAQWNEKASSMYEKFGFKTTEKTAVYRWKRSE